MRSGEAVDDFGKKSAKNFEIENEMKEKERLNAKR